MSKKLPVVGTSAGATTFCAARVDGPGDLFLWVDGNGKITRGQGDLEHPVPNAFSLPSQGVEEKAGRGGNHCPGATEACKASCYVDGLAKHAADTYAMYLHNATTIRAILADEALADAWVLTFAGWIREHCESFRWHVSGDVFSGEYASWIRDVCAESPEVEHWIYTRSFDHTDSLASVATFEGVNLALNLSVDADNYADGVSERSWLWNGDGAPRLCYLTRDGAVPDERLGFLR